LTVKLRSKRGTLSTRVKKAIFSVFRLPEIKNKAKANEISLWKSLPTVSAAYNNLFKKVNNDENSPTYMKQIIENVWPKTEASDLHTAWAISIAELLLNPDNGEISVSEEIIDFLLEKNIVSFSQCYFRFE
jgi:hypothetical protein